MSPESTPGTRTQGIEVEEQTPEKNRDSPFEKKAARTVNRHRWSGRIYQGAREIHGQGTRQIGPVTSE